MPYIAVGTRFLSNGRSFEIVEEKENDEFLAKDLGYGDVKEKFNRWELLEQLEKGSLIFGTNGKNTSNNSDKVGKHDFDDFSSLPEDLQKQANFRYKCIEPLIGLQVKSIRPYILARKDELEAEGHEVSRASLYRWIKHVNESDDGDKRCLVSSYHNCGTRGNKTNTEVDVIINQVIEKSYMKRAGATIQTVFELVYNKIDVENENCEKKDQLKHPHISTIRRRILDREKYEVEKSRKGWKHARDKYGGIGQWEKPTYPLQRVEIDHTTLDLFVVDSKNRLPIGRPTITNILDVFTGYPLGSYIGFEPPSYTAIMHALNHAIFPKTYVKEKYKNIKNKWLAYGKPEVLVTDRGMDFKSKHLKEACANLNIALVLCPPRAPWYKGAVERHFRTINQNLIHQTKGTTFSNILDKGDYDPEKNAIIGLDELIAIYHKWLIDYYAENSNKGVGGVPSRIWKRFFESQPHPAVPTSKLDWRINLMKLGEGSIKRYGIQYKHLHYNSNELSVIDHNLRRNAKSKVKFKYDPTDISKIYVYDEFEKKGYIEVPCTNQQYSYGLNEYAHRVIIKKINDEDLRVDISALAAAKAELMRMVDEAGKTTTEKKQAERVKGHGSNQTNGSTTEKGKGKSHAKRESVPESIKDDEGFPVLPARKESIKKDDDDEGFPVLPARKESIKKDDDNEDIPFLPKRSIKKDDDEDIVDDDLDSNEWGTFSWKNSTLKSS